MDRRLYWRYITYTDIQFYLLGAVVSSVMGGIKSLSRSTYSNLMPETKRHRIVLQLL